MSKNRNMGVLAEGVETENQLAFLLEHGCNEFQGFYFSTPISQNDYEELLKSNINESTSLTG